MRIVPYTKPSITNLEVDYAYDAAKNGWGKNCYDYITKFENIFRKYIKTKYVLSTSSCTGALHMGMHALGIGHGDEVILADTNWLQPQHRYYILEPNLYMLIYSQIHGA